MKQNKEDKSTFPNYTYMVRCADGTYYTGWTTDLKRRIKAHNNGTGAKYTRARTPVSLAYAEQHTTKSEAMRREAAIKKLPRTEKEALAASFTGVPLFYSTGPYSRIPSTAKMPETASSNRI